MAVTDQDGMDRLQENASANLQHFYFNSIANSAAGQDFSLWRAGGAFGTGAIPGTTAAICTKALVGAFPFTNASGAERAHITSLFAKFSIAGSLYVYDRLAHVGGLAGNVTTAQTVGVTIPTGRNAKANGSDTELWCDCYQDLGSTGVTVTLTYTNGDDQTGQTTTFAIPATMRAGRSIQVPPPANGIPIKSVQTSQHPTTGSLGNYGFTFRKKMCPPLIAVANGTSDKNDVWGTNMGLVKDDACIEYMLCCSSTSTGIITGAMAIGRA